MTHLHQNVLYRISFLRKLQSEDRHDFLLSMFSSMKPQTSPQNVLLAARDATPDRLFILVQGCVDVMLYDGSTVGTLYSGDHFGSLALVSQDSCYLTDAGVPVEFASTKGMGVACLVLTKGSIFSKSAVCYLFSFRSI